MSKICSKCGHEVDDNVTFCTACGEPMNAEEEKPAQPEQNQASGGFDDAKEAISKGFDDVKENVSEAVGEMKTKWAGLTSQQKMIVGGVAGAIVLVLILAIALGGGGGYKSAVKNFEKMMNGDGKALVKMIPPAALEKMAEDEDEDVDEIKDMLVEEFEEVYEDGLLALLEKQFGDNVKIRLKVVDKDELSDKKLKEAQDYFKKEYDIPKKSVKKGYKLDLKASIKGKDDEDENEITVRVFKIDGKWYMASEDNDLLTDAGSAFF